MGELYGDNIYHLKNYKLVPISTNLVSMEQESDDLIYLELIQQLLNQGDYYFSYTRDLTRSKQSQTSFIYGPYVPIWEQADDRFFWNSYLMTRLKERASKVNEIGRFILPIICGFFFTKTVAYRQQFDYYLISRRNRFRAGARYHSRGIDEEGNVSNFVETEQLVICNGLSCSYVQIRGSIPLFWQQQVGLAYKPKLVLDNRRDTVDKVLILVPSF